VPKLIAREKDGEIEVLDKILFETITRLTKKGDE
jgi:hypothetical protein